MNAIPKALARELLEAALDQPMPTERLKAAANACMSHIRHPDRLPRVHDAD